MSRGRVAAIIPAAGAGRRMGGRTPKQVLPLITAVIDAARRHGAAICALPVRETVKRVVDGYVESTVDRSALWAVQTPQAFRAALLREAHDKARRDAFRGTDEAMLVERLGHPVRVVPGSEENVKLTTPGDLRRARILRRRRW